MRSDNVRDRSRDATREIRRFVEEGIVRGRLSPGDKLPNERIMAEQFSAGRNTVRKILIALENEGKITRHVGRGTFVTSKGPEIAANAARKNADGEEGGKDEPYLNVERTASPLDLMELRLTVEPEIAELSAMRAGILEIDRMQAAVDKSRVVTTLQEFEDCDDELHKTIAVASRNPLFVAISQMISAVRNAGEWGQLKERTLTNEARLHHLNEHVRIVQAIRQRDAAAARNEMRLHLVAVRESMLKR
jgi:DNA-binding FadR family transcriptional regulator